MRKIFQKGSFELVIEDNAGQEIIDLFGSTVMGTPERTRYQFTEVSTKMTAINNCFYLTLRKGEKLLGTIGFVKRKTFLPGKDCDSWYIRYFSIKAPLRAKEQWDRSKTGRQDSHFNNIFKSLAAGYFDNPYLFLDEVSHSPETLLYGYVEKHNIRSQQFTRIVGLESVREFCTVAFSRLQLEMHKNITRISDEEKPAVLEAIKDFYREYTLFTADNLFFNNNYLVCRHNSEIIAGIQANPETWRIIEIPGLNGWFLIKWY